MDQVRENIICCPTCNQPLASLGDPAQCVNCGFSYQFNNGVLDFMPENDFYWGEISQDKMRTINEQSKNTGNWFKVVTEQLAGRQDLIQYFTDISRLGWLFHGYKNDHNEICVDIGSGLGSLSFKLARFYSEVYSVDGVLDRLKFQVIRAEEEAVANIYFIRSPLFQLPFQDASVDLVVVNGVLEWVGLSDFSKKPDELQFIFLQEISRILKPTGVLYVGIENRFGAQYIAGRKDHSNLPFTSLVPRWLATWVMQYLYRKNKAKPHYYFPGFEKGYRTYTYSIWGYEKLLRRAGLQYIDSNWAWPSYSFPKYSGPVDGDSIRYILDIFSDTSENWWLRFAFKLISRLPREIIRFLHKLFFPDFLFIASKMPLSNTLANSSYQHEPKLKSFTRMNLDISTKLNTWFHITDDHGKVAKVLRFREQQGFDAGRATIASQSSEINEGRPFRTHQRQDILCAAHWLAQFQKESFSGFWSSADLETEILRMIINARKLYAGILSEELDEYNYAYHEALIKLPLPIVSEQGDYCPRNILVESGDQLKVVDWEWMRKKGNPLLDVGCFSFSILNSRDRLRASGVNIPLIESHGNQHLHWFEENYLKYQHLPIRLAPAYYLLRLLEKELVGVGDRIGQSYVQSYWLNFLKLSLKYGLSADTPSSVDIDEILAVTGSNP